MTVAAGGRSGARALAVDLVAGGLGGVGAGDDGEELVAVVEDPEVVFVDFDPDDAPGVAYADVHALADDLDTATARHPPLDLDQSPPGGRWWAEAGPLEPGPFRRPAG